MSADSAAVVILAVGFGSVIGAAGVYLLFVSGRKNDEARLAQERETLKGQFAEVSSAVIDRATEQFLRLAETRLETQAVKASSSLEEQRKAVESSVGQLHERLGEYEILVRSFEKDRVEKYGSLEEQLRKGAENNERLRAATEQLKSALSNPRTRGQWGERMAEDILRAAGLSENVQYRRNRAQDSSATRPDFSFLLPDGRTFNMDVKFPLDNYLRMTNALQDEERERHRQEFLKDVRNRIREITKRDYVSAEGETLDFVLLFIPNEVVYGFILNEIPGIVDEALAKKVILSSPFTLYAVLAIVRQAHENFSFDRATREIVKSIGSFRQAFEKFRERFVKVGESIDKAQKAYDEVTGPSYKMLEQAAARIEKIEDKDAPALPARPAEEELKL